MTFKRLIGTLAMVVLVGGTLTACGEDDGAEKALRGFVSAWESGKLAGRKLADSNGVALSGDTAQAELTKTEGELASRRPKVSIKGKPDIRDTSATATVTVAWPVTDAATWTYDSTIRLVKRKDDWLPVFAPQTIVPNLPTGATLKRVEQAPDRGAVLDGAGQPLVSNRTVVIVGVEPQRITNQDVLIGVLTSIFQQINVSVDLTSLPERIRTAASPAAFIEVVTLRKEVYDRVRTDLREVQGTVFREATQPLAPTAQFARALLGQTGEVTKEILDKNPGRYRTGDRVGLNGLQQKYDQRLRGSPGIAVKAGNETLFTAPQSPGPPVKTTLDVKTQNAADAALAGETRRSALVAVRVSDGAVLAVANGPTGSNLNLAFTAQVPPGSTFKMVSTYGLLDNGSVTLDTPVGCPATTAVEGRTFKNSDGLGDLGTVPMRTAFAKSCNTAFVTFAPKLGTDGLAKAGTALGLGVPWDLGIDVFSGKVSTGGSAAEQAAAAFGQGTTLVSPIAMAGAAAAVARGRWKQPVLVTDPAPANPAPDGPELKAGTLEPLRTMMREVVTSGSAVALKGLGGAPLHGKTGTAEFDSADPTKTHAWFIGWKGDVAFAVFVENGGGGAATAVPLAGKFLQTLGV
ncbi:penicillin-binding transpeptidase domain-containing protein [Virgisporangium ochraceum]|uniref:Cell division protein FtsI n=1 Tax=Virgisporangium ochraceum TaxID=65505 RepID=A0A8J3ZRK7_9ACTN|nr:penicillin-binding transpeptidase domain-containing protein [Virgisporangium ochraceum]GIJ69214.1 cell division protein FtsI [Virgisporangium ochraceum]